MCDFQEYNLPRRKSLYEEETQRTCPCRCKGRRVWNTLGCGAGAVSESRATCESLKLVHLRAAYRSTKSSSNGTLLGNGASCVFICDDSVTLNGGRVISRTRPWGHNAQTHRLRPVRGTHGAPCRRWCGARAVRRLCSHARACSVQVWTESGAGEQRGPARTQRPLDVTE